MDLAREGVEESMREPSPDIIRDVAERLLRPESASGDLGPADPFAGRGEPGPSQHFDIFAREAGSAQAGWVVCWSDLMMTMFIMFAALYAFQAPTIQFKTVSDLPVEAAGSGVQPVPPLPPEESMLGRIHDRIRDMVGRRGLDGVVAVRLVPDKALHVVLAGDFLFGPGDAQLRAEARGRLDELADILRGAPHTLAVVGHAAPDERLGDNSGPWKLSAARAVEMAMFLGEAGIPDSRMFVAGYGDQRPVHAGDSFGRSRRVELVLSVENPTEPLPDADRGDEGGFRRWLAAASGGGR